MSNDFSFFFHVSHFFLSRCSSCMLLLLLLCFFSVCRFVRKAFSVDSHVFLFARIRSKSRAQSVCMSVYVAGCCRTSLLIYICLFWLFRLFWSFIVFEWNGFSLCVCVCVSNIITLKLILICVSMRSAFRASVWAEPEDDDGYELSVLIFFITLRSSSRFQIPYYIQII